MKAAFLYTHTYENKNSYENLKIHLKTWKYNLKGKKHYLAQPEGKLEH